MLPGDLVARLRWMSEHDRAVLVELLRTLDRDLLRIASGPAGRGVGPERPRPAEQLGRDTA